MKKLIITCALLTSASVLSFAQNTNAPAPQASHASQMNPEKMAEMRSNMLKQQLALTDDQYKKIYKLELDNATQQKALVESGKLPPEKMQEKMREIMMSHDEQVKALLTKEQSEKFEKMIPPMMRRPAPAAAH